MNPWEQGSEFHWEDAEPGAVEDPEQAFLARVAPLRFSTGRAALIELLAAIGIPRLWVPGYFCGEVIEAVRAAGVAIAAYRDVPDQPLGEPDRAEVGDAVLISNTFGARTPRSASSLQSRGLVVIEDHTHDPSGAWARTSDADWCLASLRKTLPLPDGALLWSPCGHVGPREPELVERFDPRKLTAMLLKRAYLRGLAIDKSAWRALAIAGERAIAEPPGMSVLAAATWPNFPLARRREARRANLAALDERWAGRITMIAGSHAIVLFDDHATRERIRERLLVNRIYPAILWDGVNWDDREVRECAQAFASRMLAIHVDARYGGADMRRVADVVLEAAIGG